MELAMQTGVEEGAKEQALADAARETKAPRAQAPDAAPSAGPQPVLAVAPAPLPLAQPEPSPVRWAQPRAVPKEKVRNVAPSRAQAIAGDDKGEDSTEGAKAPTRDQRRHFGDLLKNADTPAKVRKAMAYALDRNIIERGALAELAGQNTPAQEAPSATEPAPRGAQASQEPQPPPSAQPAQGGAQAEANVPPAGPPPEPTIMGEPAAAVKAAAEQVLFAATQLEGMARMNGWGGIPVEPMTLFEGTPMSFTCQGSPKRRFVELGAVEVAAFMKKANGPGGVPSPFGRRVEIGMLALGILGPGAWGVVGAVGGKLAGALGKMGQAVGSQVRRWRR